MNFFKNNRAAAAVEFALVALPVILFIFGIIQTAWVLWIDNLLHVSVDTAARCGAVNSTTPPCAGTTNMVATADQVFGIIGGATFNSNNSNCSGDNGAGLVGTYNVRMLFVVKLTLTAKSCYPTV